MLKEHPLQVFSGRANPALSEAICGYLQIEMGHLRLGSFSDGEIHCQIQDNVRGSDVFIVQPTGRPANESLMELLIILDAFRRASPSRVCVVMPYMGYARQDRKDAPRVPITAKLVANLITSAGAGRVLTIDLHAAQIQGFFDIPVDNVYASPILLGEIWRQKYPNMVVVSPDVGGVVRARALAKRLDDAELAIIDKRRPRPNEARVMNIIGEVEGRTCILVDDLVDTAGTLCLAAMALKNEGASKVLAYCTHPVLSGKAVDTIESSELDELVVTDTIPLSDQARACSRIRQLSVATMLAETMRRISMEESVSSLYMD